MKIKLRRFQAGGGVPVLWSDYTPMYTADTTPDPMLQYLALQTAAGQQAAAAKSAKTTSDGNPTIKDTLALLNGMKGLDNDEAAAISAIKDSYSSGNGLEALAFGTSSNSLINQYFNNLQIVNKVAQSKEEFQKAYDQAKSQNALSDYAVTSDGKVVVTDGKNLQYMTPEQAMKSKVQVLTNNDLLNLRKDNPKMAFQNGVLNVVQNAVGYDQIDKVIKNIAGELGSVHTEKSGYVNVTDGKVKEGLQLIEQMSDDIKSGMSIDGVYKTHITSESQEQNIKLATRTIYQYLNNSQKAYLKMHSDGTDEGAAASILSILGVRDKETRNVDVDYVGSYDKITKGVSGDGKESDKYDSATQFWLGLGQTKDIQLQNKGDVSWHFKANFMGIIDSEGKGLINPSLAELGQRYGGMLNLQQAYFGNARLSTSALNRVIVNGSQMASTELPIDMEAYSKYGVIKPDLEMFDKMQAAEKELGENIAIDPNHPDRAKIDRINKVFAKHGLAPKYDYGGHLTSQYRRFAIVSATASEDTFQDNQPTIGVEAANDQQRKDYQNLVRGATGDKKYTVSNGFLLDIGNIFGSADNVYNGNVYIPITDDFFNAESGSKNSFTPSRMNDLEEANEATKNAIQKGYNPGGAWPVNQ